MDDSDYIKGETWKFSDSEVLISEMNAVSLLYAAIHALKRMYYYKKEFHYCEYRLKIAENKQQHEEFTQKKQKNEKNLLFFSTKLEQLNVRAKQLGFGIPEKYQEVKSLLSTYES